MLTQEPQNIFERETHTGVRQDKRPPRRSTASLIPPQTANTSAVDRPAHHGSETRKTSTISGRAPFGSVLDLDITQVLQIRTD